MKLSFVAAMVALFMVNGWSQAGGLFGSGIMRVDATPVRLVVGLGKPVNWGPNTISYLEHAYTTTTFDAPIPEGSTLLLDAYLLENHGGVITSNSPGVTVDKTGVTVNVNEMDRSFRSATALAWANGKLYVAEGLSNDGTNHYVYVLSRHGVRLDRFETVDHPRAIAVSKSTLWVIGEDELAGFSLRDHKKLFTVPVTFGKNVRQMATLGDRLYVGDSGASAVHVLDDKTGAETGQITGAGEAALKVAPGHGAIGVAATPKGTLIVCDSSAVREFTPDGKLVRKIADVPAGSMVAVDGMGNIAVGVTVAFDPDFAGLPGVWKFGPDGKPLLRAVGVYMRGPAAIDLKQPDQLYKLRNFGGITGKMYAPGGVAFDDQGNLYVSDSNDLAQFPYVVHMMQYDGGIIRFSPQGEMEARLGSRFSDSSLIRAGLAARAHRLPLLRTAAGVKNGSLRFMAWGDSITQTGPDWNGGASKTELNWVHVLGRLLEAKYPHLKVQEEANGVGGQNAAESLSRNPLGQESQQPQHDLILLELGTNDQVFHLQTPEQYAGKMRDMVTELLALTDSDVVLVSPGPIFDTLSKSPPEDYVKALVGVGKEFNIPVVDMTAAMNRKIAAGTPYDALAVKSRNVHPNDAGHAVWAQAVLDVLAGEIDAETKRTSTDEHR